MPALVVPDTIEVTVYWQLNGADHAVNVLHYLVPDGFVVDQANVDEIRDLFAAAFVAGDPMLRDVVADNYTLHRVGVRDIRVPNQPELESEILVSGLGTGDVLPLATSAVVTLRTALAGRSYRGRLYLTGFAEGNNGSDGNPTALIRQAGESFVGAIHSTTIDSSLVVLGVTSRVNVETQMVTAWAMRQLRWATQRRRNVPGI